MAAEFVPQCGVVVCNVEVPGAVAVVAIKYLVSHITRLYSEDALYSVFVVIRFSSKSL